MTSRIENKNITGLGPSDHQLQMQPNYLGELSKTSRTLGGPDEGDQQYLKQSGAIGTVIRRAPRIHKRNKIRTIPYYEKKHKLGQRVSYQFF